MADAELIQALDDDTFNDGVATGVTLVDFSAEWCSPCRMLVPILEKIATEMGKQVAVAKVDTDKAPQTASNFQITSVPTLILFKDGKEINRTVGLKNEESLREFVSTSS